MPRPGEGPPGREEPNTVERRRSLTSILPYPDVVSTPPTRADTASLLTEGRVSVARISDCRRPMVNHVRRGR